MTERSCFTTPKVYFVGYTEMHEPEVERFLRETGNEDFLKSIAAARAEGISSAEILCSMFGKLCYRALSLGHNANVTRVRDIPDNIRGTFDQGHGSVFEHVGFNFVITDCSRVFTHELVRHRIGTAFSQTSGRYCRIENLRMVWDPILDPVKDLFEKALWDIENTVYLAECRLGLRKPPEGFPRVTPDTWVAIQHDDPRIKWVPDNSFDFTTRKKITSALRRIAPNGQDNEIAFSVNLRSLRHTILMRTAGYAEWEIRVVFAEIYRQLKEKYKLIFHGAKEKLIDGIVAVEGLKCQPYEKPADMLLSEMTDEEVRLYVETRPEVVQSLRSSGV